MKIVFGDDFEKSDIFYVVSDIIHIALLSDFKFCLHVNIFEVALFSKFSVFKTLFISNLK